jgi:protein gp37
MSETKIEWADVVWNPTRGCSRISRGCGAADGGGCYAERQAHRFSGPGGPYEGLTKLTKHGPRWTGEMRLVDDMLDRPLRWRKPRRIFVNSMSDLFHENLTDEQIALVFGAMALAPQHTYQILSKRAERMREWFEWVARAGIGIINDAARVVAKRDDIAVVPTQRHGMVATNGWPLKSVWLGVSVEDQKSADERIPHLLKTPAAVRWVSAEPCLSPLNLSRWLGDRCGTRVSGASRVRLVHARHVRSDLAPHAVEGRTGDFVDLADATTDKSRAQHVCEGWVQASDVSDTDGSDGCRGASHRLDGHAQAPDPDRFRDQPPERSEGRQPPDESGTGNAGRERTSRNPHAWENGPRWQQEQRREAHGEVGTAGAKPLESTQHDAARVGRAIRSDDRSYSGHHLPEELVTPSVTWVVIGGESGPGARKFHVEWARSLVKQCRDAGTACFVKQLGAKPVEWGESDEPACGCREAFCEHVRLPNDVPLVLGDRKGGDMAEWPDDLRIRQWPKDGGQR